MYDDEIILTLSFWTREIYLLEMHCEFCNLPLHDLSDARRHMLSVSHIREKRNYDLVKQKYLDRMRQATIHPKTFFELAKLLNLHSPKDVIALDNMGFFKISTNYYSRVVRELIGTLYRNTNNYYVSLLPIELREPFVELVEKRIAEKRF